MPQRLHPGHGHRSEIPSVWKDIVDSLDEGIFRTPRYPVVTVGVDINWAADPHDGSWLFRLHSMEYLYYIIRAIEATGQRRYHDLLRRTVISWTQAHSSITDTPPWARHTTALRAQALAYCVGFIDDDVLRPALRQHIGFLSDPKNYSGPWNHGFDESLGLMAAAGAVGDEEGIDLAVSRASEAIEVMCDLQGATNEQASVYHYYVWKLFGQFEEELELCNRTPPATLRRRDAILDFLAHASLPNGFLVQVGDALATSVPCINGTELEYCSTLGTRGPQPARTVQVFDRGWAFSRSGWGTDRPYSDESVFGVRFGPGRAVHGHCDHTSFFLWAGGRMIINDAGFSGYRVPERRQYELNEFGHSQVVVGGLRAHYQAGAETKLTQYTVSDTARVFSLMDAPYEGVKRQRTVAHLPAYDSVVVHDLVEAPTSAIVRQLWHAAPGFVVEAEPNHAVRMRDDAGIYKLHQLRPVNNVDIAVGTDKKTIGWYGNNLGSLEPCATITVRGLAGQQQTQFVSVLVPNSVGVESDGTLHSEGLESINVTDIVPGIGELL